MARIRSVYPGLFVDDAFMELSMTARVLLIGIWVQCDDHGIFEWRPKSLKAAILPCDDGIAINDLMGELVDQKQIKAFEIDGKAYGAVRNFCKYQHPKKPTYYYPVRKATITDLPTWVGPYVAFGSAEAGDHSPTNSLKEKEEEREKEKETKSETKSFERAPPASSKPPPAAPVALSPKTNSGFGSALPEGWTPSDELCEEVKSKFGMTDEDIQGEVIGFHAHCTGEGIISQNWSATFTKFCKRWKDHRDKQAPPRVNLNKTAPAPTKQPEQFNDVDRNRVAAFYARTGRWERGAGPDPYSPACLCPKDILQAAGIDPSTGQRTIPPKKAVSA